MDTRNVLPALIVDDVSKTYLMWPSPMARLWIPALHRAAGLLPASRAARLRQWLSGRTKQHHALSGVSISLGRGEALGIIGHNGSGKSTLLQIVAGVLEPTSGRVVVNGRIAALLELGSGFNPELTGRENARINAAILGLSADTIAERLPQILAFADIGDYIDEPVKTYSSGMALRLAFAVQVHTDPDILIVDEALAVGDAAFQAKAMAKIDAILGRGTTLLFVGHDLNAVKAFCHRAMLLEHGRVVMEGLPDEVITEYLHGVHKRAVMARQQSGDAQMNRISAGYGLNGMGVVKASINGLPDHASIRFGGALDVHLTVAMDETLRHPGIIVDVLDGKGLQLTGRRISLPPGRRSAEVALRIAATLQQGVYRLRIRTVDAPSVDVTSVLARQEGLLSFDVVDDSREAFTGLFPIPMDIEVS